MLVKTYCAAVMGLEAVAVTIEVNIARGTMLDRIRAALSNIGYKFPTAEITINMAPADIRKEGSCYDLPLAIAILAANGKITSDELENYMLVGELGLDGRLLPIRGALPIAIKARADKYKGLIVPSQNVCEAAVVNNLEVYGMDSLYDVVKFFNNGPSLSPTVIDTRKEFFDHQEPKGQNHKRKSRYKAYHHGKLSELVRYRIQSLAEGACVKLGEEDLCRVFMVR